MALVNGKALEYVINYWISNGVTRIIISIGYIEKVVKDYFTESFNSIPIIYADEKTLLVLVSLIYSSKFFCLIIKIFYLLMVILLFKIDVQELLIFHKKKLSDLSIALFKDRDSSRYKFFELDKCSKIIKPQKKELSISKCKWRCLLNK